jgi:aminoglycoside 3-N-acetyltransferase I
MTRRAFRAPRRATHICSSCSVTKPSSPSLRSTIIGGLAAYELRKYEQERSEVYIYDLAVDARHRRKGVATAAIRTLGEAARKRGAYVMFVQADIGEEDEPANALYAKLASEMIVAKHYDIEP